MPVIIVGGFGPKNPCGFCDSEEVTEGIQFTVPANMRHGKHCSCPAEIERELCCTDCADRFERCSKGKCDETGCPIPADSSFRRMSLLDMVNLMSLPDAEKFDTEVGTVRFAMAHRMTVPEAIVITRLLEAANHLIDYSEVAPKMRFYGTPEWASLQRKMRADARVAQQHVDELFAELRRREENK